MRRKEKYYKVCKELFGEHDMLLAGTMHNVVKITQNNLLAIQSYTAECSEMWRTLYRERARLADLRSVIETLYPPLKDTHDT